MQPERQAYTIKMNKLDSNFWKEYKLTPDFVIPPSFVYELYKTYLLEHLQEIV